MSRGTLPPASTVAPPLALEARVRPHGWPAALRGLARSRAALFGASVLGLWVLLALAAPLLTPHQAETQDLALRLKPPAWLAGGDAAYLLGTDQFGRDVLSRLLLGARVTLAVGLAGMLLASLVGVLVGLCAGYLGGAVETVSMRIADVQLSFPYLVLAIAVMALVGPSLPLLTLVLGLRGWVTYSRTIRGQVLSLKTEEFVFAARALGASTPRLLFRHILPNTVAPITVLSSFELANLMLTEASLSFLGLGVQPPTPSWGNMIAQGREYLYTAWWLTAMPGLALMLAVLAANQLGDGLRDLLDPRLGR